MTAAYANVARGSAVVMRNLLEAFDPTSYTVVTYRPRSGERPEMTNVAWVTFGWPLRHRLGSVFRRLQGPAVAIRVARLVEERRAAVIVAVYPDFEFLGAAREAAHRTGTPWLAYFHDLFAEVYAPTRRADEARKLQERTFSEAGSVLVTGLGMADFLNRQYGISAKVLEIGYPEPIPSEPSRPRTQDAFMGGSIYDVNDRAMLRVAEAATEAGCLLRVATESEIGGLLRSSRRQLSVARCFLTSRSDYLAAVSDHGILVVCLNWPEESPIAEAELATAFPTKVIEYIASGGALLVHCPEHYYLARFVREQGCGLVIAERSVEALTDGFRRIRGGGSSVTGMKWSALRAAKQFEMSRIRATFEREVAAVAGLTPPSL